MSGFDFDLIVVGEGIAGLSAANHAAQAGLRTATFEAEMFGGLVANVIALDPAPAGRAASGPELAGELALANSQLGVRSIAERVEALHCDAPDAFVATTAQASYRAPRVVIASGARLRPLDVAGAEAWVGRGVSSCADCDGPLFHGCDVVVVGGGDSALQEALILADYCRKVVVVHDGAQLRARPALAQRALAHPAIEVVGDSRVQRIDGGQGVEQVSIASATTGAARVLPCKGVFPFIGLLPDTAFLPAAVARDARGCVLTDASLETSARGAWAVGAVRHGHDGTLEGAIAEARAAARAAAARGR